MKENYKVPLNYKEGTYKVDEIVNFSGEVINIKYTGCESYGYIVPKYDRKVFIYELEDNHVFTATYDSDGVIKYIQLHRDNTTEFAYLNFRSYEHAKESILQFSNYWGDRISEKILEHKEKVARLFTVRFFDGVAVDFSVAIATPEKMQKVIENYKPSRYTPKDYRPEDNGCDCYFENMIQIDTDTLSIMLQCTDKKFCGNLFDFAIHTMTERIKNNVLDKLDKTDDFKFIEEEYD